MMWMCREYSLATGSLFFGLLSYWQTQSLTALVLFVQRVNCIQLCSSTSCERKKKLLQKCATHCFFAVSLCCCCCCFCWTFISISSRGIEWQSQKQLDGFFSCVCVCVCMYWIQFDSIRRVEMIQNRLCIVVIFANCVLVRIMVNMYKMIQLLCTECNVIWIRFFPPFFGALPLTVCTSEFRNFSALSILRCIATIPISHTALYNMDNNKGMSELRFG